MFRRHFSLLRTVLTRFPRCSWLLSKGRLRLLESRKLPGGGDVAVPATAIAPEDAMRAIMSALLATGYQVEVYNVYCMLSQLDYVVRTRPGAGGTARRAIQKQQREDIGVTSASADLGLQLPSKRPRSTTWEGVADYCDTILVPSLQAVDNATEGASQAGTTSRSHISGIAPRIGNVGSVSCLQSDASSDISTSYGSGSGGNNGNVHAPLGPAAAHLDVYMGGSGFRRSNPGTPSFVVCAHPSPTTYGTGWIVLTVGANAAANKWVSGQVFAARWIPHHHATRLLHCE